LGTSPLAANDADGEGIEVIGFLLYLLIIGVIAGYLARLLVPGPDPMSVGMTILLGIIGSFIGGFFGWALFGHDLEEGALQASGIIGSIIGAVIALLIYRAIEHRRTGTGISRRL
jgi:uncharacterized membrane protein YeaQ/YmgE (transglycosylase-associated protein family)